MTNITLRVTLDETQRNAVLTAVRQQFPAAATHAINIDGRFRIYAASGCLPEALTEKAIRQIIVGVLDAEDATRPGTFTTARSYDRGGQRTLKPYHASRQ